MPRGCYIHVSQRTERQQLALKYTQGMWRIRGQISQLKDLRRFGFISAGQELRMLKEMQDAEAAWKRQFQLQGVDVDKTKRTKSPRITGE